MAWRLGRKKQEPENAAAPGRKPPQLDAAPDGALAAGDGRPRPVRLIDGFIDLITYTLMRMPDLGMNQVPFEQIKKDYERLWARAQEFQKKYRFPDPDWEIAGFAVCAWVDESILCSPWAEREKWQEKPLQQAYFKTINGGDEFFRLLDAVPEDNRGLQEIFAYCLGLSFKGRYFSPEEKYRLQEIRSHNLQVLKLDPELDLRRLPVGNESGEGRQRKREPWGPRRMLSTVFFLILPVAVTGTLYFLYRTVLHNMFFRYLSLNF